MLTAVGTAIAAGTIPNISNAKHGREQYLGERYFVEIALHHRDAPAVPLSSVDPMAHFMMHVRDEVLVFLPPIGAQKLQQIKRENAIVAIGSIPQYYPVGRPIPSIETGGPQVDSLRSLQSENTYLRPEIRTRRGPDDAVLVNVGDESLRVPLRSYASVDLEPIDVDYLRETGELIEVTGRDGKKQKTPETEVASTTLTPILEVMNHGYLDAYEPEEVLGR